MHWLVTGGAGFIGSAFVRKALHEKWASKITVLDALTYAGSLKNLETVKSHPGFKFIHGNICNKNDVKMTLQENPEILFHFAAESHVDRSIAGPKVFYETNILGTALLLEVTRQSSIKRFHHISTDEVYGSLGLKSKKKFSGKSPLCPSSPYAASKASSDLLVLAESKTYGTNCVITRCSNNYGPYQYPEKLIPLFITRAFQGKKLPLYGSGKNVRDWIHVDSHVLGIYQSFLKGKPGEIYNFGGECERSNLDLAKAICKQTKNQESLISYVEDRLAHDLRYAVDVSKAKKELGFLPGLSIEDHLSCLINWYKENPSCFKTGPDRKAQAPLRGPHAC